MKITLDCIPDGLLSHPQNLQEVFAQRLGAGVQVTSVRLISIDYVTEVVRAEVSFRVTGC